MTACASEIAQVRGNCLPQVRIATARCVPQQMSSLLSQNSGPESFPDIDRKFIDRRESRDQGHARSRAKGSEIKLSSCTWIRDSSCPVGNASSTLDSPKCFPSATANSFLRELIGSYKTVRERIRHKCSRSGF